MSSPRHRSVLSPKPTTTNSRSASPTKNESPLSNQRFQHVSPIRPKSSFSFKKSTSQKSLGFKIFEDPIKYVPVVGEQDQGEDVVGKENSLLDLSNKQNHNDQENILQPSKKGYVSPLKGSAAREPLTQLSVNEYPGYIAVGKGRLTQLTEPWIPSNSNNEQKSLHKFQTGIPSFITPPRNLKFIRLDSVLKDFASTTLTEKYLFKSNVPIFDEEEEDEVERSLQWKEMEMKRKRSNSVGMNDGKLKLIKKNNFEILSN